MERAILLGVMRKYVALVNHSGGAPITALHYFTRLVEEVGQIQASSDYWKYLAFRVPDFERRWRKLSAAALRETAARGETK